MWCDPTEIWKIILIPFIINGVYFFLIGFACNKFEGKSRGFMLGLSKAAAVIGVGIFAFRCSLALLAGQPVYIWLALVFGGFPLTVLSVWIQGLLKKHTTLELKKILFGE